MSDSEGSVYSEDEKDRRSEDEDEGSDIGRKGRRIHDSEAEEGEEEDPEPEEEPEGEDLDDDDEEYDSEEYEDTDVRHKRKKSKHSGFILEEADVDEEGEEDEEDLEWEEGAEDIIDRKTGFEGPSARDIESRRRMEQMWSTQNEDEIEEYYRRKYADSSMAERFGEGEEMSDEITQQGLLPGVKDPNLWVVKCRMGEEKATVIALMRKFIAYQFTDEPLQIKSVIAKEGLKGYIYVEAYKQTHVKQAIEGVGNLRMGMWQQQMVPIKEMTDVLKVVKETVHLKAKAWVRLKRGLYKDDLAQVDYVEPSQNVVHLKLIPRIDYSKMRGVLRSSANEPEKRKRAKRPTQKLFDIDAIRSIGGEVTSDGDFFIFEGNRYSRKGFLFKSFVMAAIVAEGVKPTLSELEKFEDQPEDASVELVPESRSVSEVSHNLAPGDNVEVCEGELIHLQGKVISIDGNKITMMPRHEDLKDPLEFPAHELRKYFKMGDHVKVISGRYEGDTGLIVRVEDNMVVLFSDLTMHELKVLPKDLQLCTDRATGVDTMGQFQFGDLVQLDPQTVAVIVRLEKESFQVLNMHGKVVHVKHQAVSKRRDSTRAVALDAENNNIQVKDIVKVIDGPHSGRQGQIKHLYRSYAFLYSRMMTDNGGIFVCRTRHLVLAGGSKVTSTGPMLAGYMSPRLSSPAHPSGGGGGAGGPGGAGRGRGTSNRDRGLIGQTVRIIQGSYKGYIGIVKDATDTTARVELHSSCKTISVDKTRIRSVSDGRPGGASSYTPRTPMYGSGGQTPMYGSRTPMYGSQTPLHDGSRTPHYGSQTPLHDGGGRTPAWDPTQSNTPARANDFEYNFDEASPSPAGVDYGTPNPATPGYSADTPSPAGGPYTPQTPGSSYSYQSSPSPGGYTPSPGGYIPTPSPQGYGSNTPSPSGYGSTPSPMGYSPMTPGAPYTPQTPGTGMEHGAADWHTTDIETRIKDTHDDPNLIHQIGVIRGISAGMCSLFLPEDEKVITVSCEQLEPVVPTKGDRVKVIIGEEREACGQLLSIDGMEGVVKTDHGDLKMLQMRCLCKMPPA
ncbi:transcription elongation factor SPT5 [Lingula anatina]|uniref:Transcription elongation factor SPT5 n=1 Tax=Lingula anatina TaxID=7574 RepID=A0A1S3K4F0_LINAN|nr:transcription elongation factor SPT5-like [Lingula anatina]XP_013417136.1 transcription elongation factor SPT5-like [Lingula anatina]XP_013422071.1 transcription elongation factor SPT5 [Lingula anatina]|eukprot:XP_013417126.1 transcription elongation factor SPT5-like [Lingula anatina]